MNSASAVNSAPPWRARRLRLKHHVFFRHTEAGVQFDGGSRSLLLPGAGMQPLVERVVGLMDGGIGLHELQALLPERLQPAVQRVLQALEDAGLLLDETDDAPWLDQADVPEPLAEFVKHLQDRGDPATRRARWQAWRAGTVLLAGQGQALAAAARALADSGVGALRVRMQPGHDTAQLTAELQASGVRNQRIDVRTATATATLTAADFTGLQLAVWASDDADGGAAAAAFEQQALRHDVPALAALRSGGMALVAPHIEPGLLGVQELLQWQADAAPEPHSPASLALMGVVAAQAALDRHFGIDTAQWQRQVRRITPYLEISRHPLVAAGERAGAPGPLAPVPAGAFGDLVGQPADRVLSGYEQQRIALAPWFDPVFGPLAWRSAAGDGTLLTQLPLYHDAIGVRAPRSRPAPPACVAGWGLNAEQAGTRALLLAVTELAARLRPGAPAAALVSSFDAARWRALAAAHAVAAHPAFAAQRHVAWVDPGRQHDPVVHLLRQLLRHFAPAAPRVLLHWHPRLAACVAQVWLGATLAGSACDATALPALLEALGQACSRLQLADDTLGRGRVWAWPEPLPAQWQDAPADLTQAVGETPAGTAWHRVAASDLPAAVLCGHAVVQLSGVTA